MDTVAAGPLKRSTVDCESPHFSQIFNRRIHYAVATRARRAFAHCNRTPLADSLSRLQPVPFHSSPIYMLPVPYGIPQPLPGCMILNL